MNRRSINLLTWRFRLYLLVRARLLQWSLAWAAGSLLMAIWWQLESRKLGAVQEDLAIMQSRCTPLQQMQLENVRLKKRVADLNSHQSLMARLSDEQVPYRLLAIVSQKIAQCSGTIRVDSLSIDHRMEAETPVATPVGTPATLPMNGKPAEPVMREITMLNLNGVADGNITVSQFVGLLRDSQVFQSVELVSSIGAETDSRRIQSYFVKCAL